MINALEIRYWALFVGVLISRVRLSTEAMVPERNA